MFDSTDERLLHKVLRRLIPFCILCYLLNYIDRSNISIAEHAMEETRDAAGVLLGGIPGFTTDVFTLGVSLFFIPYCLFELPSNLIMHRVGARRWIARIMISWGVVSTCFVFTRGPWSFYSLRLLLGLAEAGFFPGILLYLAYWIPHAYRARAAALFMLSQAIAQVIGNVLAASILYLADKYHFPGQPWQWVFLAEGLPTIVVAIIALVYLTDRPADARWLAANERSRLTEIMAEEQNRLATRHAADFIHALRSPYTWVLSLLYALAVGAYFPVNFFTPKILQAALEDSRTIVTQASIQRLQLSPASPVTPEHIASLYLGLLSAIPFGIAALVMFFYARHSDRRNERKNHMALACVVMAVGLAIVGLAPHFAGGSALTLTKLVGLSLAATGFFGTCAVFWAVPAQLLTGTAVAAALAIINSIGNLVGTSLGPARVYFQWNEQSFMLIAAACAALAAAGAFPLRLDAAGNRRELTT